MAWLGKISNLGNLSDFAGAVNKFSESVKNIERNFDSALGFEARSETSEAPPPVVEKRVQEPPEVPLVTSKDAVENGSSQAEPSILNNVFGFARANFGAFDKAQITESGPSASTQNELTDTVVVETSHSSAKVSNSIGNDAESAFSSPESLVKEEIVKTIPDIVITTERVLEEPQRVLEEPQNLAPIQNVDEPLNHENSISTGSGHVELQSGSAPIKIVYETKTSESGSPAKDILVLRPEVLPLADKDHEPLEDQVEIRAQAVREEYHGQQVPVEEENSESTSENITSPIQLASQTFVKETPPAIEENEQAGDRSVTVPEPILDSSSSSPQHQDFQQLEDSKFTNGIPLEPVNLPGRTEESFTGAIEAPRDSNESNKLKEDLKQMEAALLGAARQSQMKADEISRLMIENEDLKSSLDEFKNKSSSVELDALREEYQQRVGAAERKVYALTKERDLLRRDQSRKKDSSMLLKEKDEIIKQVMAEGEELSRKQAVQEGTMRKLRAQIRELEEEKQRTASRLQVEEGKVESIRKDKAVTETALQEAVERGQAELASLRDFYTVALNEAKEAQAQAETRADSEAKADHERRFLESADREMTILQNLDDVRQALSRTEQQAAFREDMHRSDMDDLEKRCQAAESRYEELVANMPDSTRPLRRQIEALQESTALRAEAWTGVERSLNSRLQDTEAKAAAAQERERAIGERLSQTLSRVAVLEAQLGTLRAENAQGVRLLEKERQRASESRQDYLAANELTSTLEGRGKQLEDEFEQMRIRHKEELKEERARCHALEKEIDQEKALVADYEKRLRAEGHSVIDKGVIHTQPPLQTELSSSNKIHKRLPSVSSAGSIDENFVQAPVDSDGIQIPRLSYSDRQSSITSYVRGTGVSLEQLKSQLRQKEGELSSCFQRLATLESTRDSLAQELVKATTQGEFLRTEAGLLPGLRAELESLQQSHASTLELMGERDEEVQELRADLADVKQMYREQITDLVGQIEKLSATIAKR